jgi:hypothetical protein
VPVDISSAPAALKAIEGFLDRYQSTDTEKPNDTQFLARLTKVRVAFHKAKRRAVEERITDVLATGEKVIVFSTMVFSATKRNLVKPPSRSPARNPSKSV